VVGVPVSLPRVLALFSSPRVDADAVEWLRVVASFVATGHPVRVGEVGDGRRVLGGDDVPADAARWLEQVAPFGVVPAPLDDAGLRAALRGCDAVLRFADARRPGSPPLVRLTDAAIDVATDEDLLQVVLAAGQVVRVRGRTGETARVRGVAERGQGA
jgi:hypothetical protein